MKKLLTTFLILLILAVPVSAAEDYDLIFPPADGYIRVVRDLKWGLLDKNADEILNCKWDYLGELAEGFRLIRSGSLTGFANAEGKQVITPQFVQAENFSQGLAAVKNDEGKWGYINTEGTLIIPYMYEDADSFSEGRALIKLEGLYGYIDSGNNLVIPAAYSEAYSFSGERACVRTDGLYGYINLAGELVIPAQFELAFDFAEGAAVIKKELYGLIDSNGTQLIAPGWEQLSSSVEGGLLKAQKNGKWGFINTNGQPQTEFIYADLGSFSEGLCPIMLDTGCGYINSDFSLALPAVWESAGNFSEGYAAVKKDGLWGYIDTHGNTAADFTFVDCCSIAEGWCVVSPEENIWQLIRPKDFSPPAADDTPKAESAPSGTLILQVGSQIMQTPEGAVSLEAAPIIYNGYTLLPIRAVIEAIGGSVTWQAAEQQITLTRNGHVVILQPGKTAAFIDGRITLLSAAPQLENGRTLSPLRFAAEALDCTVRWDNETSSIFILY